MKRYELFDQWSLVSNENYQVAQRSLPKDQVVESKRHHRGIEYPGQSLPNGLCSNAYLQMSLRTERTETSH